MIKLFTLLTLIFGMANISFADLSFTENQQYIKLKQVYSEHREKEVPWKSIPKHPTHYAFISKPYTKQVIKELTYFIDNQKHWFGQKEFGVKECIGKFDGTKKENFEKLIYCDGEWGFMRSFESDATSWENERSFPDCRNISYTLASYNLPFDEKVILFKSLLNTFTVAEAVYLDSFGTLLGGFAPLMNTDMVNASDLAEYERTSIIKFKKFISDKEILLKDYQPLK